jgi:hypothetical protein
MTNGRLLAVSFGFKKPTYVNLEFQGLDNNIEMTVVKDYNDDVISISSDDSTDSEIAQNESFEDESDENESFGNESEDDVSEVDGYSFGPFVNDGRVGWELKVTQVVASVKKMQVGVSNFLINYNLFC